MAGATAMPGQVKLKNVHHEMYCKYYVELMNQTQAALRAGLGTGYHTAANQGWALMKQKDVTERIAFLLEKKFQKDMKAQDRLLAELEKVAFNNPMDFIEFNKRGTNFNFKTDALQAGGSVVQELTIQLGKNGKKTIKMHDKMKALDMLMRRYEMYEKSRMSMEIDKHSAEMISKGNDGGQVEIEDDGFIEAMNDVAGNMEADTFVITEGKADSE